MATHSSVLAWRIPWTEKPGRLQSMGSHRVGHDWTTSLSLFTFMHWRRKWQPTPVFLPGESQGWGSLVGCRLWGCTELDMTEATWQQQQQQAHHKKCQVGWVISWNQDRWETHQQPQIYRWYHSNSRKQRGNKEPLDELEGREWKNGLKLNKIKQTNKKKTKALKSWPLAPLLHSY